MVVSNNWKWFKMYFISITKYNWNDINLVIYFWQTGSTHFTLKSKKLKVKTAEEFAFLIRKNDNFTDEICIFCVNMTS